MAKRRLELQQENELEKRYLSQLNRKKKIRTRRRILRVLSLLLIVMLVFAFLSSDLSKVKTLSVRGNMIYTDEQILEKAELNYRSSFVLNPGFLIAMRLKEDTLIKEASISKTWGGGILITVEEEMIIGYLKDDPTKLLVQGKGIYELSEADQIDLTKIPRIGGFNEGQLEELDQAFQEVDPDILALISEMEPYATSYDADMVQFVMIDGNRVTASMKGVVLLNSYRSVLKELEGTHVCLYMDDISGNIFKEVDDCMAGLTDREKKPENEAEAPEEGENVSEGEEEVPESASDWEELPEETE